MYCMYTEREANDDMHRKKSTRLLYSHCVQLQIVVWYAATVPRLFHARMFSMPPKIYIYIYIVVII